MALYRLGPVLFSTNPEDIIGYRKPCSSVRSKIVQLVKYPWSGRNGQHVGIDSLGDVPCVTAGSQYVTNHIFEIETVTANMAPTDTSLEHRYASDTSCQANKRLCKKKH